MLVFETHGPWWPKVQVSILFLKILLRHLLYFGCFVAKSFKTRSTGTVHTSAKVRLTSVTIGIRARDPDRHQNLTMCSLAHCQPSLKISRKSVQTFLRKVANRQTNKQTNRQTNNDDYISSLKEVNIFLGISSKQRFVNCCSYYCDLEWNKQPMPAVSFLIICTFSLRDWLLVFWS